MIEDTTIRRFKERMQDFYQRVANYTPSISYLAGRVSTSEHVGQSPIRLDQISFGSVWDACVWLQQLRFFVLGNRHIV